jgi:hypothetical protein
MKRTLSALVLIGGICFLPLPLLAQTKTIVSATVVDPNGVPYAGGSVATQLVPSTGTPTINKVPVNVQNNPAAIDANGHFTVSLWCNTAGGACTPLDQSGTQWQFTITNPGAQPPVGFGGVSFTVSVTITGTTQDISSTLNAAAVLLYRDSGAAGSGCTITGAAGNLLYVNNAATGCTNSNEMNFNAGSDTLSLTPAIQAQTAATSLARSAPVITDTVGNASPVTPGSVTQRPAVTGTTDTILATDRGNRVPYNSTSAVAVTLPQAGSAGFAGGFSVRLSNQNTGTVTVTPTTSTINGNATLVILEGQDCFVTPNSTGVNYSADCNEPQITAGTGISLTRGVHSLTINNTGLTGITFPQTVGGTVTSGGVPYFNSTTQMSSSALLAANGVVLGGGAGAAPNTVAGITTNGASILTLGGVGLGNGEVDFKGNTSGTVACAANATAGNVTCTNNWLATNLIQGNAGVAINGKAFVGSGTPTISVGTGASVANNTGTIVMTVTTGAGGTISSITVGLPSSIAGNAVTNGWHCIANDRTTHSATIFQTVQTNSALSTSGCTIQNLTSAGATGTAWNANDLITVIAMPD